MITKTVLLSLQAPHFFVGIRVSVTHFFQSSGVNTSNFQNKLKESLFPPHIHSEFNSENYENQSDVAEVIVIIKEIYFYESRGTSCRKKSVAYLIFL